jgi:hypothetical protein
MEFLRRFYKDEDGNVILISAFLFLVLTAFAGLVIDGGHLYLTKTHLQKTANAAVLSGAQQLTASEESAVTTIVDSIVKDHGELSSVQDVSVEMEDKVTVHLNKPVDLFFASILGFDSVDVSVKATAQIGFMGRAHGAAPIGIPESMQLNYGQSYRLKVDEENVDTGFFGILALEGPGAKLYEENLMHGFDGELKIGDIVDTQSGNIAGKTRTAVNYLVNQCSDMNDRNCPRILLVPVYKPYNPGNGNLKQVEITGFAYFYISAPMNDNDKEINGIFLKRVGAGFESEGASNRGAYTVKLAETE